MGLFESTMKFMCVCQFLWIAILLVQTEESPLKRLGVDDQDPEQDVVIDDQSYRPGGGHLVKGTRNKVTELLAASSIKNKQEENRLLDFVGLDMTSSMSDLNFENGIRGTTPSYMISIYNKFANTNLNHASIIRSFKNKGLFFCLFVCLFVCIIINKIWFMHL